ncbi:MAG: ATP-binding protein, partial [Ferruginibacter sp.]
MDKEKEPVTIFIGENGSGKTTLLNAIFWAFTGGTTKQFSESDVLINKDAAKENGKKCIVEIFFETTTHQYTLTRSTLKRAGENSISMGYFDASKSYVP